MYAIGFHAREHREFLLNLSQVFCNDLNVIKLTCDANAKCHTAHNTIYRPSIYYATTYQYIMSLDYFLNTSWCCVEDVTAFNMQKVSSTGACSRCVTFQLSDNGFRGAAMGARSFSELSGIVLTLNCWPVFSIYIQDLNKCCLLMCT